MIRHLISLLYLLTIPLLSAAGVIHLAPNGDDRADGSAEHPLRTPHAALKMAREWRRTADPRSKGGIEISFAAGRYLLESPLYIRPEDSGTADSPTTLRAAQGSEGKVFIVGSKTLTGWIREGNCWGTEAPKVHGRPLLTRQLWGYAGKLERARHLGYLDGTDLQQMERMIDFNTEQCTITIPRSAVKGVEQAEGLEMLVHQRWAVAILRIKEIRCEGDQAVVSFLEPESYLEFAHPWPQPVIGGERGNSSFLLMNAKAFLDEDFEWWQDPTTGRIYLYHTDPTINPNEQAVCLPYLERLMTIEGAPQKAVEHLRFVGLTFADTAWNRPSEQGHVTLQGGFPLIDAYKLHNQPGFAWDANLENQAWIERPDAAISVRNAAHIDFEQCQFVALGATGLDLAANVHHSEIRHCNFRNIGGSAMLVGSFGEGATEVHIPYHQIGSEKGFCSHITIADNRISNVTREDWGAVGIGCGYVRDTEIAGNHLDKMNYSGIAVGWGWTKHDTGMRNNRIVGNTVQNYARQLYDTGGIYTLSNQPDSYIENNLIYKPYPAPYATNERGFCIYLDAATDGYTIRNNWCEIDHSFGFNNPGPAVRFEGENGTQVNRSRLLKSNKQPK